MSRNFIPAVLAIGMGILTGYYTFQPALQELQIEKRKPQSYVPLFKTGGKAEQQSADIQTKPQTPASNSETKTSDQQTR